MILNQFGIKNSPSKSWAKWKKLWRKRECKSLNLWLACMCPPVQGMLPRSCCPRVPPFVPYWPSPWIGPRGMGALPNRPKSAKLHWSWILSIYKGSTAWIPWNCEESTCWMKSAFHTWWAAWRPCSGQNWWPTGCRWKPCWTECPATAMTCTRGFQMTRSWKIPAEMQIIEFHVNFLLIGTCSMENGRIRQPSKKSDSVNEKTMVFVLVCRDFCEIRMYSTKKLPHTTNRLMPPRMRAITSEADIRHFVRC